MKRQIKFRGKRTDTGEWIYGDLLTSNGTECEISDWNDVVYSRYDIDPETVGQFTGLLDKNGKEIYNGDIVECCTDVCKVVYSDHYAGFALDKQGWAFLHFFGESFSNEDCIVIDSVHDNPGLLKGGKE